MKKIKLEEHEIVIQGCQLFVQKTRLIKENNEWITDNYLVTLCPDLEMDCIRCGYYKSNEKEEFKCIFQEWYPGLKKGRQW